MEKFDIGTPLIITYAVYMQHTNRSLDFIQIPHLNSNRTF